MLMSKFITLLMFLISFSIFAQDSTLVYYFDLNKEMPESVYQYSFIQLTDVHIGEGVDDYGTFGYLDTMPAVDNGAPANALRASVEWINQNYLSKNIKFVIVSGDLTDSGEKSEFQMFKSIMDNCQIPYVPLMGNHDTWPYYNAKPDVVSLEPKGDSMINEIFAEQFTLLKSFFKNWDDGTRLTTIWNPQSKNYNNLQNFTFQYSNTNFILADFNPRYPARFPPGPGIGPEAELLNFPGGTFPFIKQSLQNLDNLYNKNTVFVSHHPPVRDGWGFVNAFSTDEYNQLGDLFLPFSNKMGLWLAGHVHRRHIYTFAAKNRTIPLMDVVETPSNKEYEKGSFLVVNVYESPISTAVNTQNLEGINLIYPNPASKFLMIKTNKYLGKSEINILNIEGKIIYSIIYENIPVGLLKIDLTSLIAGVYFLKIINSETQFISAFEKINN